MGTNHLHTDVNIRLTDHLEIVDCGDVREYLRLLFYSSYCCGVQTCLPV